MKKIKTVLLINRETHLATDTIQIDWVLKGEGVATIKWDGTSTRIQEGKLYKRFDAKHGKAIPEGWEAAEEGADPVTGHWPGWLLVSDIKPEDKYHREAFDITLPDGTYELVGPKIQGNLYGLTKHKLIPHGKEIVEVERTINGIKNWLLDNNHEGLVFHRENGDMAKIRRKDFGIPWGKKSR
jgi:Family of unknown function (DUF5565)